MTFRSRFPNGRWLVIALCGGLSLVPRPAHAQDAQSSQGPMTFERLGSGFLVAPELKVTNVDRTTSELAGAYAGWLNDKTFFLGGGAYWLANGNHDREMAYGGAVVGWLARGDRRVGFGAKTLIGGGEATLLNAVTVEVFPPFDPRTAPAGTTRPAPTPTTISVRSRSQFFVAEPEADFVVNFTRHLRLTGGAGYRLVGTERNIGDNRLRGATGSIALQIGGS